MVRVLRLALPAQTGQLDDLPVHLEAVRGRARRQLLRQIAAGNLDGVAACLADQELPFVRLADLAARDERVLRFDPVDEAVLDQKLERAVDGGRRPAAAL